MITRVSEALIAPGRRAEFMAALETLVAEWPSQFEGLLSHEILVDADDANRVQYVSRWRDEAALVSFAGPRWSTDPVTFPGEERLLAAPLVLRHFEVPGTP